MNKSNCDCTENGFPQAGVHFPEPKSQEVIDYIRTAKEGMDFHRMISLCCLDTEYTELGTEIELVRGDIDQRQKKIRVKAARFPYNNVMRNDEVDVTKLRVVHAPGREDCREQSKILRGGSFRCKI